MISALVLTLSLAQTPAAGEPDGGVLATIYSVCPDASDAGEASHSDAGWLLPDPRGARLSCKLAGCEDYVQSPPQVTTTVVVTNIITAVVGAVVTVVGIVLKK